jgi:hypothetical protein
MSQGFRVKVARRRGFRRAVFPVAMLVVGVLSLAWAPGAFACTAGSVGNIITFDKDAYVAEGNPTQNFGNNTRMRVGYNDAGQLWHAYVHFVTSDLPTIPAGCTPVSAYLDLTAAFGGASDIREMYDSDVQAQRAAANWYETDQPPHDGITWTNKPGGTGTSTYSNPAVPGYGVDWWDVTAPVLAFYNGSANNGIVLKPGVGDPPWIDGTWWWPYSSEDTNHNQVVFLVFYA